MHTPPLRRRLRGRRTCICTEHCECRNLLSGSERDQLPDGHGACRTCASGFFYLARNNTCLACPPGTTTESGNKVANGSCTAIAGSCTSGVLVPQHARRSANDCGGCDPGHYLKDDYTAKELLDYGASVGELLATGYLEQSIKAVLRERGYSETKMYSLLRSCQRPPKVSWRTCRPYEGACSNGAMAQLANRTQHDHCGACNPGWHLDPNGTHSCQPWAGSCKNGKLAPQKTRVQDNQCGVCDQGHGIKDDGSRACTLFGGSCANGVLVDQQDRVQHNHCGRCFVGHELDTSNHTCRPYTGTCPHGSLAEPQASRESDNHCGSCAPGYTLAGCTRFDIHGWHDGEYLDQLSGAWTWERCAVACGRREGCEYWTLQLSKGKRCLLMHSKRNVFIPDTGNAQHLEGPPCPGTKTCVPFTGPCPNGVLKSQRNRTQHGDCESCDPGHYLNAGSSCTGYAGNCTLGELAAQAARVRDHHCGRCDAGAYMPPAAATTCAPCAAGFYTLARNTASQCEPYTGTCAFGRLMAQSKRTQHNHCASCDAGHKLTAAHSCAAYSADCANGAAAALELRTTDGHCKACNPGYVLDVKGTHRCIGFGGTCTNGKLIVQSKRTKANHCGACNRGHYMIDDGTRCVCMHAH